MSTRGKARGGSPEAEAETEASSVPGAVAGGAPTGSLMAASRGGTSCTGDWGATPGNRQTAGSVREANPSGSIQSGSSWSGRGWNAFTPEATAGGTAPTASSE